MLSIPDLDLANSIWTPMMNGLQMVRVQASLRCLPQGNMSEEPVFYIAIDCLDSHSKRISHSDVSRSGGPAHFVKANQSGFQVRPDDMTKIGAWNKGQVCDKKILGVFFDGN